MKLVVLPTEKLSGKIYLPASKSYSIRAFIIAACGGRSNIRRPSNCDDALVAMRTAQDLGAKVKEIRKHHWQVISQEAHSRSKTIRVGESGTVLRIVLPLLPIYFSSAKVSGKGTLKGRPNGFLIEALVRLGVKIKGTGKNHGIPITYSGGQLQAGIMKINGSISSQFISALLIAAPRLSGSSTIQLVGSKIVSSDYIQMTIQTQKLAGIRIVKKSERAYFVKGNQQYKGLKNFTVPSDYGLAAFHLAGAVLTQSTLILQGALDDRLLQADGHILPILKKMGIRFSKTSKSLHIKGPQAIKGGQFSLKTCPDLLPILVILAMFAKGTTRFYDIGHARVKESDRISDLRAELEKVGAVFKEKKNELTVIPQNQYHLQKKLNPHNDHRLAMAFAVLGLKVGCQIENIQCVNKSYPDFIKDFKFLKAKAQVVK
ncbi:MAG: 3-phosphoshikimate 1-carboxyvinyltransferase [Candidatus Omnitrophica bacterium]|nr:3-phosphoshikimate 1-carboxyvinyltransferase [Candidatus Omnitrophota bacterium]